MNLREFELRIQDFLPEANKAAMQKWVLFADEQKRWELEEPEGFFTNLFVELNIVAKHYGKEIALQLFDLGQSFTLNAFELRDAAKHLRNGGAESEIKKLAVDGYFFPTAEEMQEYQNAKEAFLLTLPDNRSTTQTINGEVACFDVVISIADEFPYLVGEVNAVDKKYSTEHNLGHLYDEVFVDFRSEDYSEERKREIEKHFGERFDKIMLDNVPMAPDSLIVVPEKDIPQLLESRDKAKAYCDAVLKDLVKEKLIARVEQNYDEYNKSLFSFGKREIIDMANKISAMSDAHDYLTLYHTYSDEELRFFLQFQNPLEVVGEDWQKRNSDLDEMSFTMDYIGERREFLLTQYALIKDVPTLSEPPQEVHKPQEQTPPAPAKRVLPPVKPEPPKKQSLNSLLDAAIEEVKEINAAREPQKQKSHKKELE
jgi:hypothetical protein